MHLSMFLLLILALFTSLSLARTVVPGIIRWTDCAKSVPELTTSGTLNTSAIDLTMLPPTLHCGQLDVPMDYSKPFCETNMITLGLAMYRPVNPKGVLFFNPGGTDAGVVVAWEVALNVTQAFDGLLDLELLVLDVRGTFSSNQLNVSLDTLTPLFGSYEFDAVKNISAAAIQSWIDNSLPPGIIQHVGTKEVVRDYEQVRKALGYEKINFLGASYGSFRATQYAATFPERVDRFVLDSVAPHGRQALDDIEATNRLMQRADAYCLNNASCPFYGKGKGSVLKAYKQVLTIARQTPFFIPECVNTTTCYPYATDTDVQTLMLGNLLGAPDFPAILDGIYAALNGNGIFFGNGPRSLESVVAMPLLCNDYGYERNFETFQSSLEQGLKNDITGIGQTQVWLIQLMCSAWPFPVPSSQPLAVNNKMLLVTADFDASAPTEWTTFAWEQAPNSALVVRHGDDHVSFLLVDQPSTKITKAFLNTGILPMAQEIGPCSVRRKRPTLRRWISIGGEQLNQLNHVVQFVHHHGVSRQRLPKIDLGIAADAYEKAKAFVAPLNNTQKIAIVMVSSFTSDNATRKAYTNTDGVSRLNFFMFVSGFPMGNANTMTWDRDLIAAQFKAVGDEYFATGYNVINGALLGPLGRVPEGGRQNEAFSPDPFLSGVAAAEGVKAQKEAGIITGVRHFLLYEQESNRTGGMGPSSSVYSSNVDDKTLHEVYMWPWGDAINGGAAAVMYAMPRVNDTHSCENNELLSGKLKEELGSPGFVCPGESAQFSSYTSANAGLDYSPYSDELWTQATLAAGVANCSLPQAQLDDMAIRSVLPYYFNNYHNVLRNHSALIRKIGGEAISLLKNDNTNGGGLPLDKLLSISLYGSHAGPALAGPNFAWGVQGTSADIFQGHLVSGGGSGQLSLPYLITPFQALSQRAYEDNSMIWWIMNNTYSSSGGSGQTFRIGGSTGVSPSYAEYASESAPPWPGIIADVLYGDVNPSGKLINTIAKNASDYLASVCKTTECPFSEGVYVDYRWFDKEGIEPRYPFGHGLSYTTFSYGDVTVTITNSSASTSKYPVGQLGLGGQVDLFDEVIAVNTTVQSTGFLDGAEVAQLYLSFPDAADQPICILRGFEKVKITADQVAAVSFSLCRRDVSYWDVVAQKWAVANGTYTFSVGSSLRDLRSNTTLVI
ncbi:hypothetical protein G7Y89_g477 [Cudoniella acicularis]|uniref:beta-glucosidase n=1 Tax=Cudoniella acicularis TaxID=354080 RepID=A0A8H4WB55_9HELO|nr:hypothetical protein G7Y89_g477 [Cudoniella acicularis]